MSTDVWRNVVYELQAEYSIPSERIKDIYQKWNQKSTLVLPCQCRSTKSLVDSLSDDIVGLVFTYLDVTSNLQLRRVCVRFQQLSSSMVMTQYWTRCWEGFKGVVPATTTKRPQALCSTVLWEKECKWAGLVNKPPVVTTLSGHRGSVTALAFVPSYNTNQELLVSGSDDGSVVVWSTGQHTPDGDAPPLPSHDEDLTTTIRIMQQHHRQSKSSNVARLHSLNGHHGPVWAVSVNGNGHVASGSFDMTVKLWDLSTGNCLNTLRGHENWVSCVHLGNDGLVVSGGYDSMIKLWREETRINLPTEVNNAVYSLDRYENKLVAGSLQSRFELFDLETAQLISSFRGAHASKTYAVQFQSPFLVGTGGCDGRVKLWDLRIKEQEHAAVVNLQAHTQAVLGLRLGTLDSAPHRLVTCSGDHLTKIFDMRMHHYHIAGKQERKPLFCGVMVGNTKQQHTLSLHSSSVFCLAMTEDKLCSGSADGTIKMVRFDM